MVTDEAATYDAVVELIPMLNREQNVGFNVFDVMHHGLHEKQVSNVFGWLLDANGTHHLGDAFQRVFVDSVNHQLVVADRFVSPRYTIRQEVNTSAAGDPADIADLVLASESESLVIENYVTSDGHGHNYHRYLTFSQSQGRRGAAVLLCRDEVTAQQTDGWEQAPVVTYRRLIDQLRDRLEHDLRYRRENPEAYSFIEQMHRKFSKGRTRMDDSQALNFVVALSRADQAGRLGEPDGTQAALAFADDLAEQARVRFEEGRQVLQRVKAAMKNYAAGPLLRQLVLAWGADTVQGVSANFRGIHQWSVNFQMAAPSDLREAPMSIKFGPSAWAANRADSGWTRRVAPALADYSHLFLARSGTGEIRQSSVTLQEVLDGLGPDDTRISDELIELFNGD